MQDDDFIIDEWLVRPTRNLLEKAEHKTQVEPKVMQLLLYLANKQGEVTSRDELLDNVWSQIVLTDVLNNTIANLRKILNDNKSPRRYIATISKVGYRLIPEVKWIEPVIEPPLDTQSIDKNTINKLGTTTKPSSNIKNIFIAILIVAVLFGVTSFYLPAPPITTTQNETVKLKTIAVLPFDNYIENKEMVFFTRGLAEELIHQLSANQDFRVIARTSSSSFEGTNTNIKKISEVLGARYIIEGSIRQSGEVLRVTVQLIDGPKGFHLWSKTFDHHQNENLLDIQMKISEKVTALISDDSDKAVLYQNRKHPQSAKAYRLFLIAQSHMKFIEVGHLEKALDYYQKSIEIAPDYALAYAGIAAAHILLYQYKHTSLVDANIYATEALNHAFEIEPNLAEAYAVRGLLNTYLQKFKLAEQNFKKAIDLSPGLRFARHNYAYMLWLLSRSKEALVQFEIALEMDPLSSITNFAVGDTLGNLGEVDKAITHYLQCQELLPDDYSCFIGLANIYKLIGDFDKYSSYLQMASERTNADNFWLTSNKAFNALINNNFELSKSFIVKSSTQKPTDYHLLETDFLLSLRNGTTVLFIEKIKSYVLSNHNNFELNLLLGQTAYFDANCDLVISQYEQGRKENKLSLLGVWSFDQGNSHILNLAYCYQHKQQTELAEKLLLQFHKFIRSLPETSHQIPGKIYNQARHLKLSGQSDEAEKLLQTIQGWPLIWLIKYDPLWLPDSMKSSVID